MPNSWEKRSGTRQWSKFLSPTIRFDIVWIGLKFELNSLNGVSKTLYKLWLLSVSWWLRNQQKCEDEYGKFSWVKIESCVKNRKSWVRIQEWMKISLVFQFFPINYSEFVKKTCFFTAFWCGRACFLSHRRFSTREVRLLFFLWAIQWTDRNVDVT